MVIISGKKLKQLMNNMQELADGQTRMAFAADAIDDNLRKVNVYYYTSLAYIFVGSIFLAILVRRTNHMSL